MSTVALPLVAGDLAPKGDRIDVRFPYERELVAAVKAIPGARFVPADKGGPLWRLPLDLATARALRRAAPGLSLAPGLLAWGQAERRREGRLQALVAAPDAQLDLGGRSDLARYLRPYQRADVAFMAERGNVINANAPGLGKTIETIASVWEACGNSGLHLVVAGITSMDVVWGDALRQWGLAVYVASGTPAQRRAVLEAAALAARGDGQLWLVVNPAMLTPRKMGDEITQPYPELQAVQWDTVIVDEFHQMGLGNPKTATAKALKALAARRRIALSGTPMGGRPIRLWSVLNYLYPQIFTSRWRWAEQWLEMHENRYASSGKQIGDRVKPGKEEEFIAHHSQFMVRRSKADVMPDLPAKVVVDVWVGLEGEQRKQYAAMDAEAELELEGEGVTAANVLSQYLRLRQLAGSACSIEQGTLWPQPKGAKLDQMLRILADHGIAKDRDGSEQAIVFTQFTKLANVAAEMLQKLGLRVGLITGETPAEERAASVRGFEAGAVDVLVMNTRAGGTALTLNASRAIVFLDETWNPDDQLQAEERNRNNTATVYYLRARGTIDEDVHEVTAGKQAVNGSILTAIQDLRRSR